MAVDLLNEYGSGRVFVDGANPRGTFKDSTVPGALDGTPYQYAWGRDIWAFLEVLLDKAGIAPSGTPDTPVICQRYEALQMIVRDIFPAWDTAHVYGKGYLVIASDDNVYQSLQAGNTGADPVTNPAWWQLFPPAASSTVQGISYFRKRVILSRANPTDIVCPAGTMEFDDGTGQVVTQNYIKELDNLWQPGNGGGRDGGSWSADTWYYGYSIYNPTTDAADYIFTENYGAPSLPPGFTKKEYIGPVLTENPVALKDFKQTDKEFRWINPIPEYAGPLFTGTGAITLPDQIETEVLLNVHLDNAQADAAVHAVSMINPIHNISTRMVGFEWTGSNDNFMTVPADALGRIRVTIIFGSGGLFTIQNYGFFDHNLQAK